jgi:Gas vesicle synthesis protein GvpL/GvpF
VIHVYAFADGLHALPRVGGLDGAPLERLSVEGVATVFSRHASRTVSRETLRADALVHGGVVDALMSTADAVLPARFGELLPDEAALAESVRDRVAALRSGFARVRDCGEVAVRVWGRDEPAAADASTGTDYMLQRHAAEMERRASLDELHRSIAAVSREARVDDRPLQPRERFVASYLVPRDRIDEVRSAVDSFVLRHPDLTIACTGPWPPYSFAGEEGAR